jgi:hypothetical protein
MTKARDIANAGTALATVDATELGYLDGVTSPVQTQVDAKIAKTLTTTTGDIIYASGANTPARLGIGSADQVLTVSSGVPAWATPSGLTLISTTTLSTGTTTISATLTSYKNVFMVLKSIYASGVTDFKMRLNGDTGSNYNTNVVFGTGSTAGGRSSNAATSFLMGSIGVASTARATTNGSINLYRVNDTNEIVMDYTTRNDNNSDYRTDRGCGIYDCSAAVSSITFFLDTGTFSGGTVYLYGVN